MSENKSECNLVVGLGQIGRPLLSILNDCSPTLGKDIEPLDLGTVDVLHICYPFEIGAFVETTVGYIHQYGPKLTVIHSTIVPGTTRSIHARTGTDMVFSPVRGKHTRMREDLLQYTKFVAGITPEAGQYALDYLKQAGFKTKLISSVEALELSKLIETTYFGLLLSWAQEVERFSAALGANYYEVMSFMEEVNYLPPVVFQPGYIGGHCVIPNTYLLDQVHTSPFIELIRKSNEQKKDEYMREGTNLNERISPKPVR